MLRIENKIRIYDDTGNGESYDVTKILYQTETEILCKVITDFCGEISILIDLNTNEVCSNKLRFYYAENY
jgi:hypothetical protein